MQIVCRFFARIGDYEKSFSDRGSGFFIFWCSHLGQKLDILSNEFEIKWGWVKAHSTDKLNNEVDLIAREAASL